MACSPFQQALHNTRLLSAYSAIDPRVKYLCYTMKVFTKVGTLMHVVYLEIAVWTRLASNSQRPSCLLSVCATMPDLSVLTFHDAPAMTDNPLLC